MDPYWTFVSHARSDLSPLESGGDDGARTRDLCRDRAARLSFSTTYNTAGTAKVRGSRAEQQDLWVGLWVGGSP